MASSTTYQITATWDNYRLHDLSVQKSNDFNWVPMNVVSVGHSKSPYTFYVNKVDYLGYTYMLVSFLDRLGGGSGTYKVISGFTACP